MRPVSRQLWALQQVICQARDQSWPDKETFWWDKKQNKRKNEEKNEQVKAKT